MLRYVAAGLALALLIVATPAYAAQGVSPGQPIWQLPMLAGGAGLALGMLIRGWALRAGRWGLEARCLNPQPPTPSPHPGIDGPTERIARRGTDRAEVSYRLIVYADERRAVHELRGRQCVIGRDPGCDVPVDGPLVSALHARITLGGGRVTLTDLDSAGGTSLTPGGPPLTPHQPAEIRDGDEFWVGPEVRVALRRSGAATDSPL